MTIQRAKCDKCGFEQDDIFISSTWGTKSYFKYACLKCKKIVTSKDKIDKCPKCSSKLVKSDEEDSRTGYTCPKCGKKKLKFYIRVFN
ncbi:MAG: hypothetical protein KKA79_01925 [Nanoarchaeota archaeon]|nr:hypothetical protein [Nanoarchaeota archaeon]MCG2717435.1 hypothetical protein [Nanoarchaeota archaeon]